MAPNDLYEIGGQGTAEEFIIGGFGSNNTIQLLDKKTRQSKFTNNVYFSESKYVRANTFALIQAEVINLSRNILITGDDFEHIPGENLPINDENLASHCVTNNDRLVKRTQCTIGLHVIAKKEGAILSLQYVRVEKCGQRGVLGKYCAHLHVVKKCPECKIIGNAFEYGHQRGTVIHGTHLATVEDNVYNDIRGSTIYIEDGNEMYNKIFYNVAICPWALNSEKRG